MNKIKEIFNGTLSFFEFNLIVLMLVFLIYGMFNSISIEEKNKNISKINKNFETIIVEFSNEKSINLDVSNEDLEKNKLEFQNKYNKYSNIYKDNIELIVKNKTNIQKLKDLYKDKTEEEKNELKEKVTSKILYSKDNDSYKNYILDIFNFN